MRWMNYEIHDEDSMELVKDIILHQIDKYNKASIFGKIEHVSASGNMRIVSLFVVHEDVEYGQRVVWLARQKKVTGGGFDAVHDVWRSVGLNFDAAGLLPIKNWLADTLLEYV